MAPLAASLPGRWWRSRKDARVGEAFRGEVGSGRMIRRRVARGVPGREATFVTETTAAGALAASATGRVWAGGVARVGCSGMEAGPGAGSGAEAAPESGAVTGEEARSAGTTTGKGAPLSARMGVACRGAGPAAAKSMASRACARAAREERIRVGARAGEVSVELGAVVAEALARERERGRRVNGEEETRRRAQQVADVPGKEGDGPEGSALLEGTCGEAEAEELGLMENFSMRGCCGEGLALPLPPRKSLASSGGLPREGGEAPDALGVGASLPSLASDSFAGGPAGSWAMARRGDRGGNREGGSFATSGVARLPELYQVSDRAEGQKQRHDWEPASQMERTLPATEVVR